jgi:hypothetical protein
MLRIILYGILIYFIYKFFKRLIEPKNIKRKTTVKGGTKGEQPRPYDKNNVEDIDYEDL